MAIPSRWSLLVLSLLLTFAVGTAVNQLKESVDIIRVSGPSYSHPSTCNIIRMSIELTSFPLS